MKLFRIQKNYGGIIKSSGRNKKKKNNSNFPFMELIKKKSGWQPPTLCEATALPKLWIINRFENISSLSQSHIWQRWKLTVATCYYKCTLSQRHFFPPVPHCLGVNSLSTSPEATRVLLKPQWRKQGILTFNTQPISVRFLKTILWFKIN